MRYMLITLFLMASLLSPLTCKQLAKANDRLTENMVAGESAILIDGTTGAILFQKSSHKRLYPASITKIATGIYSIEKGDGDSLVAISKRAHYEEGSRVYLAEGEQMPLRQIQYGLMMNSGNDAATAIAEHLEDSNEAFAEKVNVYLKEKIGVNETNFTNPHGLHDDNHYTTAYDMAQIAQYAMKNPVFREIVATKRYEWVGKEWKTVLINHNRMLWTYEGTTGIKNGFTDQARNTLVTSAKRGNTELIAVTLKAPSKIFAYKDVTAMLDYGFANFETKQVAAAGDRFEPTRVSNQASVANVGDPAQPPFYAKEDLFVTAPLGQNYHQEVTTQGHLLTTFPSGGRTEFILEQTGSQNAPSKLEDTAMDEQADPESSGWFSQYMVVYGFFALNMCLILFFVATLKKKRRTGTARRRADS